MGVESLEGRDVPWRIGLEEFNHVSLDVPYDYLRFVLVLNFSSGMALVGTLTTLLELM